MATITGDDCKLYRTASLADTQNATIDAATWVLVDNIKGDVTLNLERTTADASTRAGQGYRSNIPTLADGTVEFEMLWVQGTGDANFTALKDAFFNKTTIAMAVMDGDINTNGSQGLVAFFYVSNFSRTEPLEDVVTASVSLTLAPVTSATNAPNWYTEST